MRAFFDCSRLVFGNNSDEVDADVESNLARESHGQPIQRQSERSKLYSTLQSWYRPPDGGKYNIHTSNQSVFQKKSDYAHIF